MRIVLLLSVAAALGACESMMDSSPMRDMVADASAESHSYLFTVRAANTLPVVLTEVDRHTGRMEVLIDDMGSHMGGMGHCSDVKVMMTLRDGLRVEVEAHASAMHAMTNVVVARAEVETHVATMGMMLHDMNSVLDGSHCGGW